MEKMTFHSSVKRWRKMSVPVGGSSLPSSSISPWIWMDSRNSSRHWALTFSHALRCLT